MEKEIMDKIIRATEELRKRNDVIKEKRNAFYSEVLTTEIRKMLLVIIESDHCAYKINLSTGSNDQAILCITDGFGFHMESGGQTISNLDYFCISSPEYTEYYIKKLEDLTNLTMNTEYYYELLYNNIEKIINDITTRYKAISETQSNKLDEILNKLDVNYTPTKHVEITIKWI